MAFIFWRLCIATSAALLPFPSGLYLTDILYSTVLYDGVVFQVSHSHSQARTHTTNSAFV